MTSVTKQINRHTIAVLVDNEPGVLARVIGLFSGRGYNIESLTVAETRRGRHLSRITIVTSGTPMVIEQIKAQLTRLIPVYQVRDLTQDGAYVERELALVKVKGSGDKRVESLRISDIFRARAVDSTNETFVFELGAGHDVMFEFTTGSAIALTLAHNTDATFTGDVTASNFYGSRWRKCNWS